ncbi:MAG: thermonuclease family protein [Thermoleophilia bacterium]|nr:thermonuclease family protein [Thermoleophilia bacterium]
MPAVAAAALAGPADRVARVVDGDTLDVGSGARVRLVQIDTPELGTGECYSKAAANELRRLLPGGSAIRLEADPRLDQVDRYGRLLRYAHRGRINVNLELVRRGAATVWFYDGDRGQYAARLLAAARQARAQRRGLWGACRAVWNPLGPATTFPRQRQPSSPPPAGSNCHASYPDICIPPPPPDLDCADIRYRRFRVVHTVANPDPHRFDGNRDGVGCEG